ncbi:MAG: hypothetical protein R3198_14355, partial [Marinobacter sp.]|nr:hypothetical protein [Marinobacter sp.]
MNKTISQRAVVGLRHVCTSLVAAAALFTSVSSAAELPEVNWRMQALWDGGTTPYEFEKRFVNRVSELTDGKFTIRLFAGGQLAPSA